MIDEIAGVVGARAVARLVDAADLFDRDTELIAVVELFGLGLPALADAVDKGLSTTEPHRLDVDAAVADADQRLDVVDFVDDDAVPEQVAALEQAVVLLRQSDFALGLNDGCVIRQVAERARATVQLEVTAVLTFNPDRTDLPLAGRCAARERKALERADQRCRRLVIGIVDGGEGNDTISASGALYGDDGNDLIKGGLLDDTISGGAGVDIITGGLGNDGLLGGEDNDIIYGDGAEGGSGHDTINGGSGDDLYDQAVALVARERKCSTSARTRL